MAQKKKLNVIARLFYVHSLTLSPYKYFHYLFAISNKMDKGVIITHKAIKR